MDSSNNARPSPANPHLIKRRRRTNKEELAILEELYMGSKNPSLEARQQVCNAIGFQMKALQVWLQNRRQKEKKDAGKWKPAYTATGQPTFVKQVKTISPRKEDSIVQSSTSSTSLSASASASPSSSSFNNTNLPLPSPTLLQSSSQHDKENEYIVVDKSHVTNNKENIATVSHPPSAPSYKNDLLSLTLPRIQARNNNSAEISPSPSPTLKLPSLSSIIFSSSSAGTVSEKEETRDYRQEQEQQYTSRTLSQSPVKQSTTSYESIVRNYDGSDHARSIPSSRTVSQSSSFSRISTCPSSVMIQDADVDVEPSAVGQTSINSSVVPPSSASVGLKRTSSQYSLSIAQDGRATMKITEIEQNDSNDVCKSPEAVANISTKSELAGAVGAFDPENKNAQAQATISAFTVKHKSITANESAAAGGNNSLGMVRNASMPSFSSSSFSTASASKANHFLNSKQAGSIFAGGLRLGSPPKPRLQQHNAPAAAGSIRDTTTAPTNNNDNKNLWESLESDPVEPEDEIIFNQHRRLHDSPIRRTTVRMEDILSSSRKYRFKNNNNRSSSSSSFSSSSHKKDSTSRNLVSTHVDSSKASAIFAARGSNSSVDAAPAPATDTDKKSEHPFRRPTTLVRSATTPNLPTLSTRLPSLSEMLGENDRKRTFSQMAIGVEHGDLNDEEHAHVRSMSVPFKNQFTNLSDGEPIKKKRSKFERSLHALQNGQTSDSEVDASGEEDNELTNSNNISDDAIHVRRAISVERDMDTRSVAARSTYSTAEEPDLTFSTEASQSIGAGDSSDVESASYSANKVKSSYILNDHHHHPISPVGIRGESGTSSPRCMRSPAKVASSIFSPRKNITSPAGRHHHHQYNRYDDGKARIAFVPINPSSPLKMTLSPRKQGSISPMKNGKIVSEAERDCAAVLIGLGEFYD